MATDGLLLIGFLDEASSFRYVRERCAFPSVPTSNSLRAMWRDARDRMGDNAPWVGIPKFTEIPPECKKHLEDVEKSNWFGDVLEGMTHEFRMVEIAPLLAFQVEVDLARTNRVCQGLKENPSIQDMLKVCLPCEPEGLELRSRVTPDGEGIILETDNTNVVPREGKYFGIDPLDGLHLGGFKFGTRAPWVQVVRLGDYYYLKNGYHRAVGVAQRKATHMPCIFLTATRFEQVGAAPGKTIPAIRLNSSNPPTCGHFTQGRAYEAKLRSWVATYELRATRSGYSRD
jgi:hypothetical protein